VITDLLQTSEKFEHSVRAVLLALSSSSLCKQTSVTKVLDDD